MRRCLYVGGAGTWLVMELTYFERTHYYTFRQRFFAWVSDYYFRVVPIEHPIGESDQSESRLHCPAPVPFQSIVLQHRAPFRSRISVPDSRVTTPLLILYQRRGAFAGVLLEQ